jgi:hypothetical protein
MPFKKADPESVGQPKLNATRKILGKSISKSETLKAEQAARKGEGKRKP